MKVTNTHFQDLPLPSGRVVPANGAINVPGHEWEADKHGDNVKAWLSGGFLLVKDDTVATEPEAKFKGKDEK